jgi:hypothetical protein
MNFVYPQFLYALFAVGIPVAIHLFSFRRYKQIYFSDIRFLKTVTEQTNRSNKLKHILILISRILAIVCLVLAFAQPFIPVANSINPQGTKAISIYIDNSFSMENVGTNGRLLDEAKRIAREVAFAYSPANFFQLLTNDFEGKHQRLVNREEFLTCLDEIKISPEVKTLPEIYSRQQDLLNHSEIKNKQNYLISDFQESVSSLESIDQDTSLFTSLLPIASHPPTNLSIDSCWFDSPVHPLHVAEKLFVRVINYSPNKAENIALKLYINNRLKTPATVSLDANETKTIELAFSNKELGIQNGKIELTDYPISYDDKLYFSYTVAKTIPVLCLNAFSKTTLPTTHHPVQLLFGNDSLFSLSSQYENKIDYSSLDQQQVIILNELQTISSGLAQELSRFILHGGSVLIFPPANQPDTFSYKTFLSSLGARYYYKKDTLPGKIDRVNTESDIFSGVFDLSSSKKYKEKSTHLDLPTIRAYYTFAGNPKNNQEVLLSLKNKNPIFSKYPCKKGKLYVSALPLHSDWSNLAKHALFVPLLYKIALSSYPPAELFYTIGKNQPIVVKELPKGEDVFKLCSESYSTNRFEIIPESKITDQQPSVYVRNQVKEAGNYLLLSGKNRLLGVSFNYDRKESDLRFYPSEELQLAIEKNQLNHFSIVDPHNHLTQTLAEINNGKKLWKGFIALSLLFFAVEVFLLRRKRLKPRPL